MFRFGSRVSVLPRGRSDVRYQCTVRLLDDTEIQCDIQVNDLLAWQISSKSNDPERQLGMMWLRVPGMMAANNIAMASRPGELATPALPLSEDATRYRYRSGPGPKPLYLYVMLRKAQVHDWIWV
ncbi:hypothetical protein Bbelb_410150 [Branchiostoma belcheri]|nr:hypothetical protein Bbelb_410150 [Branchiostoma belcheri]